MPRGRRVRIYMRGNRKVYQAEWTDPVTGKQKTKGLGTSSKAEAEREAGMLEQQLASRTFRPDIKTTWAAFRIRHEQETDTAPATKAAYAAVFNHVERVVNPRFVQSIGPQEVTKLAVTLRKEGLEDLTVKGIVSKLLAALKWAAEQHMLWEAPKVALPRASQRARGRPITEAEYREMRNHVAAVVGPDRAPAYRRLLDGLWLSGLRIKEAVILRWDDGPMTVDLTGRRPMFVIHASADKARKGRRFPIAPDFARFLQRVPERDRKGFVFDLPVERAHAYGHANPRPSHQWVSRIVERVGRKAKVVVGERKARNQKAYVRPEGFVPKRPGRKPTRPPVTPGPTPKYASAHDFRRAFGFRWAMKVMPAVLQALMRHQEFSTTMNFYVGHEADRLADVLWTEENQ